MSTIDWELISILIVLIAGFGKVIGQIGARAKDIELIHHDLESSREALKSVRSDLEAHEKHCGEREKEIAERLSEGSTKMALLAQGQENIKASIAEIKELVEKKLSK